MPEENQNPEAGAQPEAAPEETFTLTRAQMDEFRQRAIEEAKQAAPPAPPKMDPLSAYYAGQQGRAQQKPQQPAAQPQGNSDLSELTQLMKLQIMSTMAPKPPPAPKPMSAEEKLSAKDPEILLGRGANGWSAADADALRAKHRHELVKAGYKGNVEDEARIRASREIVSAFESLGTRIKVVP